MCALGARLLFALARCVGHLFLTLATSSSTYISSQTSYLFHDRVSTRVYWPSSRLMVNVDTLVLPYCSVPCASIF